MSNVRRLARNIAVDISTDNATWLRLPGRVDTSPQITPNKQDSTDYDTNGWSAATITLQSAVLTVKYNRLIDSGTPNAVQATIDACVGQFGATSEVYVRWYDLDGGTEGWTGQAIVEKQRSKTGVADLREEQITLTVNGQLTAMTSAQITAAIGNSSVPVITSASQSGTGVGSQVKIVGANFTGASAVKFGATSATQYTVVSDSVIVAVVPTGGTGAVALTVTTTAGTSAGFNFTVA